MASDCGSRVAVAVGVGLGAGIVSVGVAIECDALLIVAVGNVVATSFSPDDADRPHPPSIRSAPKSSIIRGIKNRLDWGMGESETENSRIRDSEDIR